MPIRSLLLASLFILIINDLRAQIDTELGIEGPQTICANNCATFLAFSQTIQLPTTDLYVWMIASTNGTILHTQTSIGPVTSLCFDTAGVYTVIVRYVPSNFPGTGFEGITNVYVFGLQIPELLYSDAPPCPAVDEEINNPPTPDTLQCERVCPQTTVTYTFSLPIQSPGPEVLFQEYEATNVSDIQVNGNQVTITWANPGIGTFTAYYTSQLASGGQNFCTGEVSLCVEVLAEPQASFTATPGIQNDTIKVCLGEEVQFNNTSINANGYFWSFGDFTTSTLASPQHNFSQAGIYEVYMIAQSGCTCADTARVFVLVENTNRPPISCNGAVCTGMTVTYTTDGGCGQYDWTVSANGTVVAGGGPADDFITITWHSGYIGSVTLDAGGCPNAAPCMRPTTIEVPIISEDAQISGPSKVCPGSTARYTLPEYNGAAINWSVSSLGTIVDGQGTNEISVSWPNTISGQQQWVAVSFDHCYLGCSGADTLQVDIRPPFRLTGPIEVCPDANGQYFARSSTNNAAVSSSWQVYDAQGQQVWSFAGPDDDATVAWSVPPGNYEVVAFPAVANDYCLDSAMLKVVVPEAPPAVDSIAGARFICTNRPYTYEAISSYPGGLFNWTVTIGGSPSPRNGQRINITWLSPANNSLSVTQVNAQGCASPPLSINIQTTPPPVISGDDEVCKDGTGTYSTTPIPQAEYEWSILPVGAGTIISDPTLPSVEVLWHSAGNNTVRLKICNQTGNFAVTVHPNPVPVVNHPASVCNGATVAVQTSVPFADYLWRDASGSAISNIANPMVGPGNYQVIVVDANGCRGDALFEINDYPGPLVQISTPDSRCLDQSTPTLYTLANQSGAMFEWFLDGTSLGVFTSTYTATAPGAYTVNITDANGCTQSSNALQVYATCVGGGGGSGFPGGQSACDPAIADPFAINATIFCNVRSYQITDPDFVPGTALWNFDDPASGANNVSNIDGPTHTYSVAGFHEVALTATYNDGAGGQVTCGIYRVDTIPLAADFIVDSACPGAPADFIDRSTSLPIVNIVAWDWDFGDPASGAANNAFSSNPMHIYNTPGSYTVALTVTSSTGCQSTLLKQIDVLAPPSISFDEPVLRCEDQAMEFATIGPANLANVSWDFGDPGSGDANNSTLFNSFHTYEVDAAYSVALSATDIYGCTNVFDRVVNVVANSLTGNIAIVPGNQICEGDTATLTAPAGGVNWSWSNGDSLSVVSVIEEGLYKVTLTDAFGCQYIPNQVALQVIPAPSATIRSVFKDELGQPIAYVYDSLQVCQGEDVFLEAQSQSLSYTYQWSNGQSGQSIEFSENRGNLLPVGTHLVTTTVTDALTGCSIVEGPFVIIVHPNPANVQIASSPSGILCESVPTTFSVINPEAGVSFYWNTGQTGASIVNSLAGDYYATAVNTFGCQSRSDTLAVLRGPNIKNVPNGCYTRCRPDTFCIAPIAGAVSYQWFLDGAAIAAPEGTQLNLVPPQSGAYTLQVTDVLGCTLTSAEVSLDLFDGYGPISGSVYVDVNSNGVIDLADTLYTGPTGIHITGLAGLDTLLNTASGAYIYINAPADSYNLQIDTTNLPNNLTPAFIQVDTALVGCNDSLQVNWLLSICQPLSSSTQFTMCEGDMIMYNGQSYFSDTIFIAVYQSLSGCDSIDMVAIQTLPTNQMSLSLETCPGTQVDYNGAMLSAGQQMDFVFTNQYGCDSTITVVVDALPLSSSNVSLSTCPGTQVDYNGAMLSAGQQMDFVFTNQYGCDSTVTVVVNALSASTGVETLQACTGTTVTYQGATLSPGSVTPFTLANSVGCDSVVTVTVVEVFPDAENLNLTTCAGQGVSYNGTLLQAGTQTPFVFTNQFGCDSVVTVIVSALTPDTTAIALSACEGTTVMYNGLELNAGETVPVVLTDQNGCDSVVIVKVDAIPNPTAGSTTTTSCPNSPTGSLDVVNVASGLPPYEYTIDGVNYQASPGFSALSAGTYTVLVRDDNGCIGTTTATVAQQEPIILATQEFILPCEDLQVSIFADITSGLSTNLSYQWDNGDTIPDRIVTAAGIYTLQVSNNCETVSKAITVEPEVRGKLGIFYIPNAFSPNKDGINDAFEVYTGTGVQVEQFRLIVFDRWGNQLFATEDYSDSWDGNFRGKELDPGVFVWYLKARVLRCGQMVQYEEQGDITILR